MFCLIVFNGFPYSCILTKDLKNPISDGKSGKSLFAKSRVFNFFNFIISFDIFLILLSESTRAVKLGHLSKYENYVNLLNDSKIESSFYEFGN
jgi:hypothetical protein